MSGLDELRQRVEAAEGHFGMIAAQSETYSTRLTGLMTRMEQAHAEQQREIGALTDKIGRTEAENRELRGMLLGLLQAIETGDGSGVGNAVRDLEHRIDTMVGGDALPVEDIEEAAAAAPDEMEEPDVAAAEIDDLAALIGEEADPADDLAEEAASDAGSEEAAELLDDTDLEEVSGIELADESVADMADLAADANGEDTSEVVVEDDLAELLAGAAGDAPDAGAVEVIDDLEGDEIAAAVAGGPALDRPIPETIALDDTNNRPEQPERSASPADELLSRVDAVANALMAGGIELDQDDDELTGEISALLQDAIGAKRAQLQAHADDAVVSSEDEDIAIEDWADASEADEIAFEQDAA